MKPLIAMKVMELEIQGLPDLFDEKQLQQRAHAVISDLARLLGVDRLLQYTTLTYRYRLHSKDPDGPLIVLVLELAPRPQRLLDFLTDDTTLGTLEKNLLADRQRLRHACQELPVQNSHAAIALAQRLHAGFLDLPDETLAAETEKQLAALVNARHRHWNGYLSEDDPWQMELPTLPRYQWSRELLHVRAKLSRERRGFTLKLLRRATLPAQLRSIHNLRMPDRPPNLEDASMLDRAEYTGTPVDLVIRVGSVLGSESISVADFVRLADAK
ncbi:hypothetical protein J8G26_10410 [Acidovorax sp. JG5]|uniref:hypothetical protein n=1 Tax=Acidovorax sp. JG5 TaxID=2822718 RepID=UPI001B336E8A|nr:hypothetical protein [Acidovorax sp. JG5]MBP3981138.1 hypothetical protein [Acidovorax sp. JG5]